MASKSFVRVRDADAERAAPEQDAVVERLRRE
jgi:hypothetical protein